MLNLMKLERRIVLDGAAVAHVIDHAVDNHDDAQVPDGSAVPDKMAGAEQISFSADAAAGAAALLSDPDTQISDGYSADGDLPADGPEASEGPVMRAAPSASDGTVTVDEDVTYTFNLADFESAYTDPEGDPLLKIQITKLESAGSLLLNGQEVGLYDEISATDIQAGNLTFVPNQDANGSPYSDFRFKVHDGTAYSVTAANMVINVTPVQDAPTALDNTVVTDEDTSYVFERNDFLFNDVDVNSGDTLQSVMIMDIDPAGTLQLNGQTVTEGAVISVEDIVARRLIFVPATDANGVGYSGFSFKVSDGKDFSVNAYRMTVDVNPVNDLPTASDQAVTLAEDTPYTFKVDDFGFTDPDIGDRLQSVQINQLETAGNLMLNGREVNVNEQITRAQIEAGEFTFVPDADANGAAYSNFRFKVSDGTAFSQSAYTMVMNVTPVNDPPTSADNTVTTGQNTDYTFKISDFSFNDVDKGDSFQAVKITRLETAGDLLLKGEAVSLNQEIDVDQIEAGNLVFAPGANASGKGYSNFGFQVSDGEAYSKSAYNMDVNVTVGNIPPSGADQTVTLAEDTQHVFKVADFGFSDPDGGTFTQIRITQLETAGELLLDGQEVALNQEIDIAAIDAGDLVFVPNKDAYGDDYSTFRFKVHDGTAYSLNGNTMTMDVTPVQDAPTSIDNTVTALEVDPSTHDPGYKFQLQDFIFNDVDLTDHLTKVRITDLSIKEGASLLLNGVAVTEGTEIPVEDIMDGDLVFIPVQYEHGDDYSSFRFEVHDGTEYSHSDYTMTIDVAPVNQRPQGPADPVSIEEDTEYTFKLDDFKYKDFDGYDLQELWLTKTASAGTLLLNGEEVNLFDKITREQIENGQLKFKPNADAYGDGNHPINEFEYADFQFRVNNGVKYSADAYLMPIIVTPVNDPPTSADDAVSLTEDMTYTFNIGDFEFDDMEGDNFKAVQITDLPDEGVLTVGGETVTEGTLISTDAIRDGQLVYTMNENIFFKENYDTFRFKVQDDGAHAPQVVEPKLSESDYQMTIDVDRNQPPEKPGPSVVEFREGDAPISIVEDSFSINDPDSDNLSSITIRFADLKSNHDELMIGDRHITDGMTLAGTSITVNYEESTGILTFEGMDSVANYQNAVESVRFFNPSENPFPENRNFTIQVTDDRGLASEIGDGIIRVIPVNDAPVNLYSGTADFPDTLITPQDAAVVFSDANGNRLSVKDVDAYHYDDAGNIVYDDIRVTLTADNSSITVNNPEGVTVTGNGTEQVVIEGTVTEINEALAQVRYNPGEGFRGEAHLTIFTNDLGHTGEGGPMTDTDTITLFVGNPPPAMPPYEGPPAQELILEPIARPPYGGLQGLELGAIPFPGDVQETGGRMEIFRALMAGPCGNEQLYECCTLEEALKIGCRLAPAYDPEARLCNITWDYLEGTLGWDDPFVSKIEPFCFTEFDLFHRLFMREEGDPGFCHRPGEFAEAFGAAEEEAFAKNNRDEEHDVYSQLSMQGAQGFNDVGPGGFAEVFLSPDQADKRAGRWRPDGGDPSDC